LLGHFPVAEVATPTEAIIPSSSAALGRNSHAFIILPCRRSHNQQSNEGLAIQSDSGDGMCRRESAMHWRLISNSDKLLRQGIAVNRVQIVYVREEEVEAAIAVERVAATVRKHGRGI
jgi:hypothetical protein